MKDEIWVVKVGTSTLTYENGRVNLRRMECLCRALADLQNAGKRLVLVSSGAIGVGMGKLGLKSRPAETEKKQALAAVGQCELMFLYDKFFGEYNQTVAQVLLTAGVVHDDRGRHNVENTFRELLTMGTIPIVNENDTVETSELEGQNFGDNDTLSAVVAELIAADFLVILTDTDGLYDSDPRKNPAAKLIPRVENITPEIEALAGGAGSIRGTGGMATKLRAAKMAGAKGIPCAVVSGADMENLYRLLEGKPAGTLFAAGQD
ncbi:glutamate 5-kinase [Neglecta sp. X4]|uniref:glutamate 5-kinase n=1 Tax=unclassified Neglectibacter TaxID=2632164 RepID=UPI00136E7B81|nr:MULTISPECIES: glutamate 5-kinase [unclassified Neglectibacter]NBI18880.1 glutamate 5-kinase [Neglectibacter sp. 59]NBJ74572.1 glutamate 5-kinase [Neglectibacter sp. X4]NCE82388.1 glutamate 5-kinase [Neglectibacter sp. X58]